MVVIVCFDLCYIVCLCPLGPKPKVKRDDFEDLLSTQGFGSKTDKKMPRTIAEMRKQELSKGMDPLKLQVGLFSRFSARTYVHVLWAR